jgi:hypothetical protein
MTSEIQVLTLWGCHILITMFLPISFKNEYNEYVVSESLIVPCLNIKKKYDQPHSGKLVSNKPFITTKCSFYLYNPSSIDNSMTMSGIQTILIQE